MSTLQIVTLIFNALIFAGCACVCFGLVRYFRKYRIFSSLFAKLNGDVAQYDRIRRAQMRSEIAERDSFYREEKKKKSFLNSVYRVIGQTGIVEKVPEFSESGFLVVTLAVAALIFGYLTYLRNVVIGGVGAASFCAIVWYLLSLAAYSRKVRLEKQLLQFTNACASASLQYTSIIDIFGAIYDQFTNPLREGLEACYVEAKQFNNTELALQHLKERYDSSQFSFIIDNLQLCSSVTGDYHTAAKDISEIIAIFSASHEKKRAMLRSAKMTTILMFGVSIVIMYGVSVFIGGIGDILLCTTIGNILLIAMVLILFYGLNIKAEK